MTTQPFGWKNVFLFTCCIIVRSMFVYIAYTLSNPIVNNNFWLLCIPAALLVLGWIRIIFFVPRDTGLEVNGGKIWWKNIRIFHLSLYLLFAISTFTNQKFSWIFLLADVLLGSTSFLFHHYTNKDFENLML